MDDVRARVIEILSDRLDLSLGDAGFVAGDIDDKIARGLTPEQIADEVMFGEDV